MLEKVDDQAFDVTTIVVCVIGGNSIMMRI